MIATMILAAGLGTRLRPLTNECPKPLVPVGDRPLLGAIVAHLRATCGPLCVNAHHHRDALEAFAKRAGLTVSLEHDLLGTAGGVRHAKSLLGTGDVLVWNGDIVSSVDPLKLVQAKQDRDDGVLFVKPCAKGEGNVGISDQGRVVRLRKETFFEGEARGGEFLGIHLLGARLRSELPEVGCLVGDVYMPALRRGATLRAVDVDVPFIDVGTLAAYLDANLAWLQDRSVESFVSPSARVDNGSQVVRSVVGEGATVEASIDEVVVWPGARVTVPLKRAIVTPQTTVFVK